MHVEFLGGENAKPNGYGTCCANLCAIFYNPVDRSLDPSAGARSRAGRQFSVAADHADRAVPAGRLDRCRRPHHGRQDGRGARPAGDRRKRRRRRRLDRRRPARARDARRLHDRYRPMDTHVGSIIYNISFDLRRDFAPIGLISINPMLLVATKALPADDLKSLIAYMKAHPGDAKFVNQNASAQVGGLLLQKLTGTDVLFVPYRGAGPAMTDLISGQVDLLLVQGAVALPQVRAGTIKALAELSPDRSASMPDIPSAGESGVAGLNIAGWFGFYAPKGTPADVVAKLNAAMVAALADPAVKARFAQFGLDVATREQQTPDGLA